MRKPRVIIRVFPFNRLTWPLLLNIWETHGLDGEFDIRIADAMTAGGARSAVPRPWGIADIRSDDVFVYSFMSPHLPLIAEEIRKLKAPGAPGRAPLLVAGGPHVRGEQELALACGFDRVYAGDGEGLFLRLGHDLLSRETGKERVVYEDRGTARRAPPYWDAYIPVSKYFKSLPPLELMRGCFWNCRYCQTGARPPLFRGRESLERYLREARQRGFKRVSFISPSALEFGARRPGQPNGERLEELLSLCRRSGFRFIEYGIFPSEVRPDTVTAEAVALLRNHVANRRITIGGQSGDPQRLAEIRRGHGVADIERAIALANEGGFRVNLDLIFAFPGETSGERRETIAWIRNLQRRCRLHVHLHHFFPLAGSDYAWRLPSFLSARERQQLLELRQHGIASDWWLEGEKQARAYFAWLKKEFPHVYKKFA